MKYVKVKASRLKMVAAKEYCEIIMLQNPVDFSDFKSKAGKGREAFFEADEKAMLKYLMQWDMGEDSYGECYSKKPWGSSDTVYKKGNYRMSYNSKLGYAALCVVK